LISCTDQQEKKLIHGVNNCMPRPLTYAPIPKFTDVVKAFIIGKRTNLEGLAKPWLLSNEKSYWFSRSAWSLYAVVKFRMMTKSLDKISIWLPSYFCNESTIPIRTLGCSISFYPVLYDGTPDAKYFDLMLEKGLPDIILFVHYYGKPTISDKIYNLSKKNKIWLIEDAAHCIAPDDNIGRYGDFVIYSPHKIFAIPDGGLLLIRNDGPNNISYDFLDKFGFNELYYSIIHKNSKLLISDTHKWVFKRLLQMLGFRRDGKSVEFKSLESIKSIDTFPHPMMSSISYRLLGFMISKMDAEKNNRKANQIKWYSSLRSYVLPNLIEVHDIEYTPYLAQFVFNDVKIAESFFIFLKSIKIPVSTWPDLPPEVLMRPSYYNKTIKMKDMCFYLPVHQSINPNNIELITDIIDLKEGW